MTIGDNTVLDIWSGNALNAGSSEIIFDGNADGVLYIGDITTYDVSLPGYIDPEGDETFRRFEFPLYNVTISKNGGKLSLAAKSPGLGPNPSGANFATFKNAGGGKNTRNWANNLVKINNVLFVDENTTFSQLDPITPGIAYSIRLYGANITNFGTCFEYTEGNTDKNGLIKLRKGGGNITINTNNNSVFGNLRLNSGAEIVFFTSNVYVKRLEFRHGRIDIGSFNLKIDNLEINLEAGDVNTRDGANPRMFSSEDMIRMSGTAASGGLSLKVLKTIDNSYPSYVAAMSRYNDPRWLWFPIGTNANASNRYTPAVVYLHNTGTTDGDEYITVKAVDGDLQTTELTGGDLLSYYWKVDFEGYAATEEPTVSWLFQYAQSDVSGSEASYVPGKVLNVSPFTRSDEGSNLAVKDGGGNFNPNGTNNSGDIVGTNPANIILFNGIGSNAAPAANDNIEAIAARIFRDGPNGITAAWQNAFPGTGFALEKANYTAGAPARFVGAPEVYYSRRTGNDMNWTNNPSWSKVSHTGAAASDHPKAGDIAIIYGSNVAGSNGRHWYEVTSADVNVAEIIFINTNDLPNGPWAPRISVNPNRAINASTIDGRGTLYLRMDNSNVAQINADIGGFAANTQSVINYRHNGTNNSTIDLPTNISEYPRLDFESSGGNRTTRISHAITVNYDMAIGQNSTVQVDNDVYIKQNLRNRDNTKGSLTFAQGGNWTLTVDGRIRMGGNSGLDIQVLNTSPNSRIHRLRVGAEIYHQQGVFDLYNGTGTANNAILELFSETEAWYEKSNTASQAELYRIIVNKGSTKNNLFTLRSNITLQGTTNTADKALEILNGTCYFDNDNLNITLSSGGGNFYIPNILNPSASSGSGGLHINKGTARVLGDDTGIILDGDLIISNTGTLNMDDAVGNGNNFIEYSSSANAFFNLSGGTATIGGQFRGSTINNNSVINFTQSGGTLIIGKNAAPNASRGVFEIPGNNGSSFTFTGGTLRVSRANGVNPTCAAIFIRPQTINTVGNGTLIAGDQSIANQNILVDVLDNNNDRLLPNFICDVPATGKVKLSEPLATRGDITINANATLDANGKTIRLTGNDFTNNGTFTSNGNNFIISNNNHQIYGNATTFYDLTISPSAAVSMNTSANVSNNLIIQQGTFALGTHQISVKGNLVNQGAYSTAAGKIILDGAVQQEISGSGTFGRTEVNNSANGILALSNLYFEENLEIREGVLKIGDLLLHLGANASFVSLGSNPFSTSKMIRTNVVTSDRGLRKTFNSVVSNFTFPVGVVRGLDDVFTPVSITFNSLSAPKSITIIPVNGVHPTVVSPFRALDFYWKVFDSNPGTTGSGSVEFNYVQALVDNPANEVNYIPARLQGVNWAKFPSADVDEASNTISFTFDNTSLGTDNTLSNNAGSHYTAGLDADIPNQIPVFQYNPNANGAWNDVNNWRRSDDGGANYNAYGAGIPVNGPSGQLVHIPAGAVVNAQGSDTPANMLAQRNPYSTQIDGELIIGNTRANSLGIVSGAGKITLGGSDRAVYPAGDYAAFLANPNSTVEYTGSLSYTIDNRTSSIGNLIISGGGTKTLPSGTQNVNNNLTVASGTVLNNTLNNADIVVGNNFNLNGTLNTGGGNNISVDGNLNLNAGSTFNQSSNLNVIVKGNITKNASATVNSNNSSLTLNGNAVQTISGQLTFNNLTVNNAAGITVSGADAFTVESNLTLSNGLINTTGSINTSNFRVKNGNVTITGASQSSYINGPMQLISLGTGTLPFSCWKFKQIWSGAYQPNLRQPNLDCKLQKQQSNRGTWRRFRSGFHFTISFGNS